MCIYSFPTSDYAAAGWFRALCSKKVVAHRWRWLPPGSVATCLEYSTLKFKWKSKSRSHLSKLEVHLENWHRTCEKECRVVSVKGNKDVIYVSGALFLSIQSANVNCSTRSNAKWICTSFGMQSSRNFEFQSPNGVPLNCPLVVPSSTKRIRLHLFPVFINLRIVSHTN